MVFTGNNAKEYVQICTRPNLGAQILSRQADEEFGTHSAISYGSNGEVVIKTDLVDWDSISQIMANF